MPLSLVDPDFAKEQLSSCCASLYLHPNGQIPAYEWNFGDVNPPVHAWATHLHLPRSNRAWRRERSRLPGELVPRSCCSTSTGGSTARTATGKNVFEGGFLGLDNIGVFDRSAPLAHRRPPRAGRRHRLDGVLLPEHDRDRDRSGAERDPRYEDMRLQVRASTSCGSPRHGPRRRQPGRMWDEEDGFFYDVLRLPDGSAQRLKVRSMVGLLPLCASHVFDRRLLRQAPASSRSWFTLVPERSPGGRCAGRIHDSGQRGHSGRRLASPLSRKQAASAFWATMLDEDEFLSPYGIRSLSALPRRASLRLQRRRAGVPRRLPAGGIRHGHVRRQLELARADLDAGQRPDRARRCCSTVLLLRRRLHGRVPDRLGPAR